MDKPPSSAQVPFPEPTAGDRLDSWKEIAAYLRRGVRAVQRWEKEERLPVHRHLHKKLDSVYAYKRELDAWWDNRQQSVGEAGKTKQPPMEAAEASIAVLPFVNLSPDKQNEYFSDGMTEELINALANVRGLRVVSRTSVFQFKGKAQHVRDIGKQLNVRMVLEGSVRKAGDRLRITVQLIDVADGYHLWSDTYERELKDVFSTQDEISRTIVSKLRIKLIDEQRTSLVARHTGDFEAYNSYLKGRHYWNQRSGESFKKGIECFEQAIERDPDYALAYAGLADSYNMLGYHSYLSPKKAFPKAKTAALKALQRDDGLAEAHVSLAFSHMFYDWDWRTAEMEFKRALELKPDYATAHYWYGLNLASLGRPYEAVAQVRRAQELDPLSPVISIYVAGAYYFARQYDRAIEKCLGTLGTNPDFGLARLVLGWAYRQKSMFREAIAEFKKAISLSKGSADAAAALGHAYAVSGRKREAKQALGDLQRASKKSYVSPGHFAIVHWGLGEKEAAIQWLQKACEERHSWLVFLKVDPIFDGLRSEPRFAELLGRVGLTPL